MACSARISPVPLPPLLTLSPAHFRPLILKRVGVKEICSLACTCTQLRDMIHRDRILWHGLTNEEFPGILPKIEALKGLRDWRERFVTFYLLTRTFISIFELDLNAPPPRDHIPLQPHQLDGIPELQTVASLQTWTKNDCIQEGIFRLPNGVCIHTFCSVLSGIEKLTGASLEKLLCDMVHSSPSWPHRSLVRLRMFKKPQLLEFITSLPLQATLNLNPSVARNALIETALARRHKKRASIRVVDEMGQFKHGFEAAVTKLSLPMWVEDLKKELQLIANAEALTLTYADGSAVEYNLRFLPEKAALVCTYTVKKPVVVKDETSAPTKPKGKNKGGRTRW